ncbi:MAG: type II secretion system GspH family protein [Deltaproteobacteria bacterium]
MGCAKMKFTNNRGFTMIEVIAVLVVLGILVAVAASRIISSGNELYAERDLLKSNLRFAQLKALSNNDDATTTWGVKFSGSTYTLQRNGTNSTVNFPTGSSPTHSLSGGVTVSAPADVAYNFWGSSGTNDIAVTLSQGGQSIPVSILRTTGFIP